MIKSPSLESLCENTSLRLTCDSTIIRIEESISILDNLMKDIQFQADILACWLGLVKKLLYVKTYFQIVSLMLERPHNADQFAARICKEFNVLDHDELAHFQIEKFNVDNFSAVNKFVLGYVLDQLRNSTSFDGKSLSSEWKHIKNDFLYLDRVLSSFNELLSVALFPTFPEVSIPQETLRTNMKKYAYKFSVGDPEVVKELLLNANSKLLKGFAILNAKSNKRTSPFFYASILLKDQSIFAITQVFQKTSPNFSLNYFEESEVLRSSIKLLLHPMKTYKSLFVPYNDSFLSNEIYQKMQEENLQIDPRFLSIEPNLLCTLNRKEKPTKKPGMLKIKILHSQRSSRGVVDVINYLPPDSEIVVYLTGGGFIADLEKPAQFYLRELSIKTGKPIFIIKYRVAPTYKFPIALNDVINGYLSILHTFRDRVKSIMFMGESAGANLFVGLINYLILIKSRLPDKVLLIYPALMLSKKIFCPSLLKSYTDITLNFSFLDQCLRSYLPADNSVPNSIFLSPLLTPKHILERFPPTYIMCGKEDPLYDNSLIFAHRLFEASVDVKLLSINCLAHGFMGLYFPISEEFNDLSKVIDVIETIWKGETIREEIDDQTIVVADESEIDKLNTSSRKKQLSLSEIDVETTNQELVLQSIKSNEDASDKFFAPILN